MLLPVARFAPCGLAELTADGTILAVNETLLGWLELAREAVVGHRLFEFVHDESDTLRAALQSDEWDGTPFTLNIELQSNGPGRPLLIASSSYFVDEEQRMSVVFFDATISSGLVDQASSDRDLAQRVSGRLEVLVETAASFGRSSSESELGEHLVEAVKHATGADEVAAYLLGPDGSFIQLAGTNPLVAAYPPGAPTVAAEALRTGDPIVVATPADANVFAPGWGLDAVFTDAGIESVIVAPIVDYDRIGAVTAFFRKPIEIDDQVLALTGALARQAAQVFIRLRLEAEMRRAANRDIVTGLANRRLLEERSVSLAAAGGMIAALFLDLDKFKLVNDERGHDIGDRLLAQVGQRISSIIRDEDGVARFGGDEFVAVCPVPDEQTAFAIAERVRDAIAQPYDGDIADVVVKASVGVAIAATPVSVERLIRTADAAMYEAKNAGGNVVRQSVAA